MKKFVPIIILIIAISYNAEAQKRFKNKDFCHHFKKGSYFPLDIKIKKVGWFGAYYYERLLGEREYDGHDYKIFEQAYSNGHIDTLYLREDGEKVYEFKEVEEIEILRLDPNMPLNETWPGQTKDVEYSIISKNAILETPFCVYRNLLVIKTKWDEEFFLFYYMRGFGYVGGKGIVGSSTEVALISAAIPDLDDLEDVIKLREKKQ